MNRKETLKKLVDEWFGGSQAKFAKAIEKNPAQVNQWFTGGRQLGDGGSRAIELALHLPQGFFDMPRLEQANILKNRPGESATTSAPDIRGKIPLITWEQAATWQDTIETFSPDDAEAWMTIPYDHGQDAFALRVSGESMLNTQQLRPSFHDGDIILVDPDAEASSGSIVVVRIDQEKEASLRRIAMEGGRQFLGLLNLSWPTPPIEMTEECSICGVVIAKMEKL